MPLSDADRITLLAAVTAASDRTYAGSVTTLRVGGCTVLVVPPPAVVAPAPTPAPAPTTTRPMGWDLTERHVGLAAAGVDRRTLPFHVGAIAPGSTISLKRFSAPVNLANLAGVTLDRCWISPAGGDIAVVLGRGTVLKDCDIDCHLMQRGQERYGVAGPRGIGTQGVYRIERCHIRGAAVGLELDSESAASIGTVTETWVHDMVSTDGAHLDTLTRRAGDGALTISRCRLALDYPPDAGGTWATAAVFLQATWGPVDGVTLTDNLIEGNGYGLLLEAGCRIVAATNNRFRPTEYGPVANRGGTISSWVSNYTYNPTAINAAGTLVPRP